MSHSCKIYRFHETMRVAFAVRLFFAVDPGRGKGWIRLRCIYYWRLCVSSKETARIYMYIYAYRCSHLPHDRYLGFFSPSEVAIVVAPMRTSIHADAYQGFGRMPRGLFADDFWPRLSVRRASQQFHSRAPCFLRFRRDCSRNDFSIVLDSDRR